MTPTYDTRGNLTSAGGTTYSYDSTNRLVATPDAVLKTDPAGRLFAIGTIAGETYLLNSGDTMIGEYSSSGAVLRRYVHGPGVDEPLVWYEGSGTSDRRYFHADERGSVIAVSNGSGSVTSVNAYDESGIPASTNTGRFQYTGQQWIGELGMYHYRARIYSPYLGRFLQTDPIGFEGGMNFYAYVGNDPINLIDPFGLQAGAVFGSRDTAAQNATQVFFRLGGTEWGGGIYRFTDIRGNVGFFYTAHPLGPSGGRFSPSSSGPCAFYSCTLVAAWHTHNLNLALVFSTADRRTANRNRMPLYLGVNGETLLFVPTGNGQGTSGGVFVVREPAPQLPFLYTLEDFIIDSRSTRFGPGETLSLIVYLMRCIVGEVDICEGMGPGIGIATNPREMSENPLE